MLSAFFSLLFILQPIQYGTVQLSDKIHISFDHPEKAHAEPHLSVHPSDPNELLLASIVLPDSSIHYVDVFQSTDGGTSWKREKLPISDTTDAIDPWTALSGEGEAYVSVLAPTTFSNGRNFLGFKLFSHGPDSGWIERYNHVIKKGGSYDQPKIAIDQTDGPFQGRIYVSGDKWGNRTSLDNSTQAIGFMYSDNSGRTFSQARHISENNLLKGSLNPVILSDGTLVSGFFDYMTIGNNRFRHLVWSFRSPDGGKTVTYPNLITSRKSLGMTTLAVDRSSGEFRDRIYMSGVTEDSILAVYHSDSEGDRWAGPRTVAELPGEDSFVSLSSAVDGNGVLSLLWGYKLSEKNKRECYQVYFSYSKDGGESFKTRTLRNKPFCVEIPGEGVFWAMADEYRPINPRFSRGGEYLGLAGLPTGGFYAVWVEPIEGILHLTGSKITFSES